jgi:hypothetical protein
VEVLHDVQLAARSQLAQAVHVSHHSPVQDAARCRIPPLQDTCIISSEPRQDRLEQHIQGRLVYVTRHATHHPETLSVIVWIASPW